MTPSAPPFCPWGIAPLLAFHSRRWPAQNESLADLSTQARQEPSTIFERSNMRGHATGSCLIIDPRSMRALEILHKATGMWLPPGGHADPGETPLQAALREAAEEVGADPALLRSFPGLEAGGGLLDIDTHPIAANARKGEGVHRHHDFAFAFTVHGAFDPVLATGEVGASRWQPIADMLLGADPRPRRLGAKLIELSGSAGLL